MSDIGIHHDLRGGMGPARDQGLRPTCLAFAFSDGHAAVRAPWIVLSCEYLFFHSKKRDGEALTTGTTVKAIRETMSVDGQPIETSWPYLDVLPTNSADWTPPSNVTAVYKRNSELIAPGFDTVWDLIEDDRPPIIVMTISNAFYFPLPEGLIDSTEPIDLTRRHAVLGVATGKRAGHRLLLVRNSWSESWGISGYGWLSERYLSPRILDLIVLEGKK